MKNEAILKSLNIIKSGDMSELDFLIDVISREIREAELKKSNGADYVKLSKKTAKILKTNYDERFKTAIHEKIDGWEKMQVIWHSGEYVVCLRKDLDIPTIDRTEKAPTINSILCSIERDRKHEETAYDIGDIKLALVNAKDKKHPIVKVGCAHYNPQFFIDIVEFLGGSDKVTFYQTDNKVSFGYFESDLGKAVLCPIKVVE